MLKRGRFHFLSSCQPLKHLQSAQSPIQPLAIMQALHNQNLDDKLVDWYYNFLTHRHLITEHNGVSHEGNLGISFPQRGV